MILSFYLFPALSVSFLQPRFSLREVSSSTISIRVSGASLARNVSVLLNTVEMTANGNVIATFCVLGEKESPEF